MKGQSLAERLWQKVDRKGPSECWIWNGAVTSSGYGHLVRGRRSAVLAQAHRVAYELARGPIPKGLDLDHLCRNRRCVNPAHLEPVSRSINLRRSPRVSVLHCPQGHPYDMANTHVDRAGRRHCRACDRERHYRKYRARFARIVALWEPERKSSRRVARQMAKLYNVPLIPSREVLDAGWQEWAGA